MCNASIEFLQKNEMKPQIRIPFERIRYSYVIRFRISFFLVDTENKSHKICSIFEKVEWFLKEFLVEQVKFQAKIN